MKGVSQKGPLSLSRLTASLLLRENRRFTLAGVANLELQFKDFATPAENFLRNYSG